MNDLVVAFLRENPGGVSSRDIAERFLKFKSPEERLAALTVKAVLGADRRCVLGEDGLWRPAALRPSQGPALQSLPWAAVSVVTQARQLVRVSVWSGRPQAACLADEWFVDPATLPQEDREALAAPEDLPFDASRSDDALASIAAVLAERAPVYLSGREEAALSWHCAAAGVALADNAVMVGDLVRAGGASMPRPASVEGVYGMLLGSRPAGLAPAAALAECVDELVERLRQQGIETLTQLQASLDEEAAAFDFSGKQFTWETLAALPQAPGVYGFKDAQGAMIYIGKAQNLRRRVCGYFRQSDESPEKLEQLRSRAVDLTASRCGSELEALIYEHRLIVKYSPALNTQAQVNERRGQYRPIDDCVVLLPHAEEGKAMSVWFRRNQKIQLRPFAVDFGEAQALAGELQQFFFSDKLPPAPTDFPEQEIAARWLRRNEDDLTVVPAGQKASGTEIVEAMRYAWREAQ